MSNKCKHPNEYILHDDHEGSIICTKCAHVIDVNMTIFPSYALLEVEEEKKCNTSTIDTIVHNNNINSVIYEKAKEIMKDLLQLKINKNDLNLSIYAIYIAGINTNNPYTIEELALMLDKSIKQINRIINTISKVTKYRYLTTEELPHPKLFITRYCASFLSPTDIFKIKRIQVPKTLLHKNPRIVIAGMVYYYFRQKNVVFIRNELCLSVIQKTLNVKSEQITCIANEIKKHNH